LGIETHAEETQTSVPMSAARAELKLRLVELVGTPIPATVGVGAKESDSLPKVKLFLSRKNKSTELAE
jgi:hypothetical protein